MPLLRKITLPLSRVRTTSISPPNVKLIMPSQKWDFVYSLRCDSGPGSCYQSIAFRTIEVPMVMHIVKSHWLCMIVIGKLWGFTVSDDSLSNQISLVSDYRPSSNRKHPRCFNQVVNVRCATLYPTLPYAYHVRSQPDPNCGAGGEAQVRRSDQRRIGVAAGMCTTIPTTSPVCNTTSQRTFNEPYFYGRG